MKLPITGGCNCGAVRYEVTAPLVRASYCHCRRCQRRSGAAASAQAHPAPGTFRIVAGREHSECGSRRTAARSGSAANAAMFGSNHRHPESIGIRMGMFDDDPDQRVVSWESTRSKLKIRLCAKA